MKNRSILFLIFFMFLLAAKVAKAEGQSMVSSSANLVNKNKIHTNVDFREHRLKIFLLKYNSPLTQYAGDFIRIADLYSLDWRLIPSITGVESTFGKRIPRNSYNAYGWANGEYRFLSWESSIEHVAKTLRSKYYNRGADNITKIAGIWAPPSKTWAKNVKYFMTKIDSTPIEFDL